MTKTKTTKNRDRTKPARRPGARVGTCSCGGRVTLERYGWTANAPLRPCCDNCGWETDRT